MHRLQESTRRIETIDQFKNWIRDEVRPVLPHEAFVCGHGRMHATGVAPEYIVAIDFPCEHLGAICNLAGGLDSPLMRRWMMYREPQMFDMSAPPEWPELSLPWLQQFAQHDLHNAAVHAFLDTDRYVGTYFSFHRLPQSPEAATRDTLVELTPLMHETLAHVILKLETLEREKCPSWEKLTQREAEMLQWIERGMSNIEIAAHMDVSENTVKHHITSIFEKTGVTNRSSLISAIALNPPGRILKGTKLL